VTFRLRSVVLGEPVIQTVAVNCAGLVASWVEKSTESMVVLTPFTRSARGAELDTSDRLAPRARKAVS
jgi:hypothetical protein